jgi:hypothetical protein
MSVPPVTNTGYLFLSFTNAVADGFLYSSDIIFVTRSIVCGRNAFRHFVNLINT